MEKTITDVFKLPIDYNKKKQKLKENIINDLELVKSADETYSPILHSIFNTKTIFSKQIMLQSAHYYTTDKKYLKDTQILLDLYAFKTAGMSVQEDADYVFKMSNSVKVINPTTETYKYDEIWELYKEIKNDTGFKNKYYYIDWSIWEFLNKSENFLQFMSIYNMASPVLSFFIPIFVCIIPFFILKSKGIKLTMSGYFSLLQIIAGNHAIFKVFTHFNKVPIEQKAYLCISAFFYVFSIYQNTLTCLRFHQNMSKIHIILKKIQDYTTHSLENMTNLLTITENLKSYESFNTSVKYKMTYLKKKESELLKINTFSYNLKNIGQIGFVLKSFYELYDDKEYNEALLFSFGLNGYIENIKQLSILYQNKIITMAKFSKNKTMLKGSYYAPLWDKTPVKNDVCMDKSIIITGPNASGKTTILKSTLINVILTQQYGCGFYENAQLVPYEHIHCYLNIPDTSGRDSLFQAEARRCKEIIECIKRTNITERHFCVFDELFSGTNPEEATTSATFLMEYLTTKKNVFCLLTTHFTDICYHFKKEKTKKIKNYKMIVSKKGTNDFSYTYKCKQGISNVKGCIKVLCDLNYPEEIIQKTKIAYS
jgi:hypothetical protein